ncbi:MAG TPA: MSMEG_6728 family protein [Acidimicrobiales bacterium]|nr:MSMEG_6728 family protein [Acidimicrobiales bacterium]
MQTFLPHRDFAETARVLDQRRLGKQRVETLQILRALLRPEYGWKHHPAVLMWAGREEALACYGLRMCDEWVQRGFADTVAASILEEVAVLLEGRTPRNQAELASAKALPSWLGDEDFHRSHRSALLRKEREHYVGAFGDMPDDLEYVWPVRKVPVARPRRAAGNA